METRAFHNCALSNFKKYRLYFAINCHGELACPSELDRGSRRLDAHFETVGNVLTTYQSFLKFLQFTCGSQINITSKVLFFLKIHFNLFVFNWYCWTRIQKRCWIFLHFVYILKCITTFSQFHVIPGAIVVRVRTCKARCDGEPTLQLGEYSKQSEKTVWRKLFTPSTSKHMNEMKISLVSRTDESLQSAC